jgi:hypothetical protein
MCETDIATRGLTPRRLAQMVAAVFAVTSACAEAATRKPTNCLDGGSGSLRAVVAAAHSGDTIDLSQLSCSSISLSTGAIDVVPNDLTFVGKADRSVIVARGIGPFDTQDRIFHHTGTGTLTLANLTVGEGYLTPGSGAARGGCVFSAGNVHVINSTIEACFAISADNVASGGAIYSAGYTIVEESRVSYNEAEGASAFGGRGGGVASVGYFTARYSVISHNQAAVHGVDAGNSVGGGVAALANKALLRGSTFYNNNAYGAGGALYVHGSSLSVGNSTITGNTATRQSAGIYARVSGAVIGNSTIAINTVLSDASTKGVGLEVDASQPQTLTLFSTILSGNQRLDGSPIDIGGVNFAVNGSHNLVRSAQLTMPADTLTSCPRLKPLHGNGGITPTMGLYSGSPAIDRGNNIFVPALTYDQRGSPHLRQSGSAPDIGAFEVDQSDTVFDNGFEGC